LGTSWSTGGADVGTDIHVQRASAARDPRLGKTKSAQDLGRALCLVNGHKWRAIKRYVAPATTRTSIPPKCSMLLVQMDMPGGSSLRMGRGGWAPMCRSGPDRDIDDQVAERRLSELPDGGVSIVIPGWLGPSGAGGRWHVTTRSIGSGQPGRSRCWGRPPWATA